jgi:hypothetical protein
MIQRAVGPVAPLRGDRVPSPVWIVHDNSRLGGAWVAPGLYTSPWLALAPSGAWRHGSSLDTPQIARAKP